MALEFDMYFILYTKVFTLLSRTTSTYSWASFHSNLDTLFRCARLLSVNIIMTKMKRCNLFIYSQQKTFIVSCFSLGE